MIMIAVIYCYFYFIIYHTCYLLNGEKKFSQIKTKFTHNFELRRGMNSPRFYFIGVQQRR